MKEGYIKRESCRICGNKEFSLILDLGDNVPLANNLTTQENNNSQTFPLKLYRCKKCGLSQIRDIIDSKVIFPEDYPYSSSVNQTLLNNFSSLVNFLFENNYFKKGDKVLDIGCNDGALLDEFRKKEAKVLGIDPAIQISKLAKDKKIEVINGFWSKDIANKVNNKYGKFKIITATNVFAHVDDVISFIEGVDIVLDNNGTFVIEVSSFDDMVKENAFDSIYHEHLTYYLAKNVVELIQSRSSMKVTRIDKTDIHCGSYRFYINKDSRPIHESVKKILDKESKYFENNEKFSVEFQNRVKSTKDKLKKLILDAKNNGKLVVGLGAPAKAAVLLSYCGLDKSSISYIVDNSKFKQGKLIPGLDIKIVPKEELAKNPPNYILVLSWNIYKEIISSIKDLVDENTKFIIPLPEIKVISKKEI